LPDTPAPFAAYVAHELRTPLATQRALLELALADLDADTAAWRHVGNDVLEACKQQERLLEACLALSRSQSGLSRCERVDLASIVAVLVRSRDLRGLTVNVRLGRALTTGDPELIERLLDNLLVNAVRHNTVGGWIEVTAGRTGRQVLFTIENTGHTIPSDELTGLFEPFQQLSSQNTRSAGGLGLGLAVVKAVADAHGAQINARARPSGGLRVEVAFPATADKASTSSEVLLTF